MLIVFVLVVCILPVILLVHEVGHLVVARYYGVRVLSVSVGFGPELLGVTDRFGTRWALAALPLGACLKMSDNKSDLKESSLGTDTLSSKSLRQRAAIYAGGPIFSLMLAVGICGLSIAIYGEAALPGTHSERPEVVIAFLLGGFSALVGLFNLIPIPPLDGGSLVLLAIEAFLGRPISARACKTLCAGGMAIITMVTTPIAFVALYKVATYSFF